MGFSFVLFFSVWIFCCCVCSFQCGSPKTRSSETDSWTIRLTKNNIRYKIPTLILNFVVTGGAPMIDYFSGFTRKTGVGIA